MVLTITTARNVSTVQIKWGSIYIVENSCWREDKEARFPWRAIFRGVRRIARVEYEAGLKRLRERFYSFLVN